MSTKAELELKSALLSTGLVQPVESTGKGGSVSVLCRQVPGQEKPWLQVARNMLIAADDFDLHLCRRYVLKNGQLVFGWHLSLDVKNVKAAEAAVAKLSAELAKAKPQLEPVREERPVPARARGSSRKVAAPDTVSSAPQAPGGVALVSSGVDAKGKPWSVQEMPLPHVARDLNVPNEKGKGSRSID